MEEMLGAASQPRHRPMVQDLARRVTKEAVRAYVRASQELPAAASSAAAAHEHEWGWEREGEGEGEWKRVIWSQKG